MYRVTYGLNLNVLDTVGFGVVRWRLAFFMGCYRTRVYEPDEAGLSFWVVKWENGTGNGG